MIGGGTMGVGIALSFANAGVPVKLLEINDEALQRGLQRARETYAASVKRGSLTEDAMEQRLALIAGVTDYGALADADVVVEAVFEEMGVKQQVFEQLDAVCKPGAILASNTSSLDLDAIAAFTRRPEDVVGLHFFSPANVMRLLEVVRGGRTSDEVLATAMAIGKQLKKVSVVVGVCDGFVGNRMVFQYGREAEFLLEEGATPQQVDAALRNFGMAMGPFAMRDLSGLDIGQAIRKRQRATLPAHLDFPTVSDKLCAAGMLGQKTGAGYYRYEPGNRTPQENPDLAPMLEAASRKGHRAAGAGRAVHRRALHLRAGQRGREDSRGRHCPALQRHRRHLPQRLRLPGLPRRADVLRRQRRPGQGAGASKRTARALRRLVEAGAAAGKLAAEGRTFTEWQAGQ